MGPVLVTGAFGLVGAATVRQLADDGRQVVATDLDVPAHRRAADRLPSSVTVHFADLTDPGAVDDLVSRVQPAAIAHLAAVIPPLIYGRRALAQRVNVDATTQLLAAAARQQRPPRFVQASSIAVYGSRNPHTVSGVLTADTAPRPADVYGAQKLAAEQQVRAAALEWVILRLGGVMTVDPMPLMSLDNLYFEGLLPTDGRLQTVDVRDVAAAFSAATTAADAVGQTLLIGGDDTHRLTQGQVAPAMAAAMGLVDGLPTGLPGDPARDDAWFATDWLDGTRAQQILGHQHRSWPDMLAEVTARTGAKRHLLRLAAPVTRRVFARRGAYHRSGRRHADPWPAIAAKFGDPRPTASP
ncbi:NAD(P)-dependent oxidoreductase [Mycolicibacillus parakoreensis]|uniref:NAD(P)-dependent oxidoreductase n=1 Tax=Mycolicibacillus parakoreensis TaxID=1069221 RepID=A0ABY3U6E9_9MYCO|nr:NAD(P)-dependent oxidoreductase [Mycolicibacillus parakoreensis]MCV7315105.1 NAD(P)-dependent oxidoreductase [Mycolicibacillus parakoreensis]ULN53545.1 NAD(P)-dependent oxidoreductase [Mycolicibacillus parakoreensis]HLR98829.1 NAD(P)-dependent oxidoreductase [Mycolicibacillus parakoreensis]